VTVSFHEVVGYPGGGRQIVTRERLEILGLAMRRRFLMACPPRVIQRIVEAGGIPVLPGSPGKWLFARGQLVGK